MLKAARRQIKATTGLSIDNDVLGNAIKRLCASDVVEAAESHMATHKAKKLRAAIAPKTAKSHGASAAATAQNE